VVPERGLYRMMYYPHNIHFLAHARMAQGKLPQALRAAEKLVKEVEPSVAHLPPMESFLLTPTQVLLRFHQWNDVLKLPEPPQGRLLSRAFWHFARGVALAAQGKKAEGRAEQQKFREVTAARDFPRQAPLGFNTVEGVMGVAAAVLAARLAEDADTAWQSWTRAVQLEDALRYGEPPDWYYPVRESLGAALLRAGNAAEAEKVFRQDLARHRRNPRSLFGLREALRARKKAWQVEMVDAELARVWKGPPLRLEDF
jgi:hypothetical protein